MPTLGCPAAAHLAASLGLLSVQSMLVASIAFSTCRQSAAVIGVAEGPYPLSPTMDLQAAGRMVARSLSCAPDGSRYSVRYQSCSDLATPMPLTTTPFCVPPFAIR